MEWNENKWNGKENFFSLFGRGGYGKYFSMFRRAIEMDGMENY